MHPRTGFIWGKYRPKWPESAQNRENPLFHCRRLSRPSPISRASQDLKIPFKTLKLAYFYLKHVQIPQKSILKQVLSDGSTAQNGQKVLKITKIHHFTQKKTISQSPRNGWKASFGAKKVYLRSKSAKMKVTLRFQLFLNFSNIKYQTLSSKTQNLDFSIFSTLLRLSPRVREMAGRPLLGPKKCIYGQNQSKWRSLYVFNFF